MAEQDSLAVGFLEPGELIDAELRLVIEQLYPGDSVKAWVPAYRFGIMVRDERVGDIELRLGTSHFIVKFAGQVGYRIDPAHRGKRFAARALRLLVPLAKRVGFHTLWLTVDPRNAASRRSCELAGATLVEIVDLPKDCEMYREGDRQRCRYRLEC